MNPWSPRRPTGEGAPARPTPRLPGPALSAVVAPILALLVVLPAGCAGPRPHGAVSAEDRAAVLAVVEATFEAIRSGDPAGWDAVLLEEGTMSSVAGAPGEREIRFREFAASRQPSERAGDFLERSWEPTVLVDGDVATVWTRYDFFIDGAFSHGGTDVFVLLRTDDGWRIASLVWTVETDPEPSPLGPPS